MQNSTNNTMKYQYFVVPSTKVINDTEEIKSSTKIKDNAWKDSKQTPYTSNLRTALFWRMQSEGLLSSALHSFIKPTLADWLELTKEGNGWLLCCTCKNAPIDEQSLQDVRAIAWLSPICGKLWSFDFTVFRAHFSEAVAMSQGALRFIFSHDECHSLLGICAKSNRHAWQLAQKAGFSTIGSVPKACYFAKKERFEDGILVMASAGTEKHLIS